MTASANLMGDFSSWPRWSSPNTDALHTTVLPLNYVTRQADCLRLNILNPIALS
jgi:hypothetical protein